MEEIALWMHDDDHYERILLLGYDPLLSEQNCKGTLKDPDYPSTFEPDDHRS